ncbi:MAG: patatin-like phospholipase family protein [Nostoc sp. EfeVER01]|uniref:patatin-like phospholipase family protein n=1 Tax=unclassified Nostoc TaxID=2593658 RepID=UPI002AD556CD|nr:MULTISPECIES: patatin-like phospholipase family protein [unclassified Nostoc]MDZ7947991.1 patatin-like phospholipase family protein [Nostoc sp. EfeVER01]MDZ7991390.1 patatin-like phospholipase family protein [Nostoc sp. EspVER01]
MFNRAKSDVTDTVNTRLPRLTVQKCLFLGLFLLIIIIISLNSFWFPLRVPIFFGLILFFFPILANILASALFQNLFVIGNRWQLASVMVGSTMAALMVSITSERILEEWILHNDSSGLIQFLIECRYIKTGILLLPTWIYVCQQSRSELKYKKEWILGILTGLAASAGFVSFIVWLVYFFQKVLGSYIFQMKESSFFGLTLGLIGFGIYGLVIWLFQPGKEKPLCFLDEAPALLYISLLIWILTGVLSGLTFWFDPLHIPVFISLIMFSGLMYYVFETDHYFEITEIPSQSPDNQYQPEEMKNFSTAIETRLKKQHGEKKTLVVVAASGGGIQAAGWTVKVLSGLQEELGPSFTQATGLISSVSGGSVGTMFFLDQFMSEGFPSDDNLEKIFQNATEDNLDAVGWGLAGPDLMRILCPFVVGKYDRGYAIEDDWKEKMCHPNATLATRREQIFNGQIPIPVFNATLVEDGRRFLISPMTFFQNIEDADKHKAFDFNNLFNNPNFNQKLKNSQPDPSIYDLSITTAARLSASFPYVSPIARNDSKLFTFNYHVADGGYFDNSGMFTAVEWLDEQLKHFSNQLNIKRILLLQINASPEAELLKDKDEKYQGIKGDWGWVKVWLGPLEALYSVRDSTQFSRNFKEVELLKKRGEQEGVDIQTFVISFPKEEKYKQPLSWKLSKQQKQNLKEAWEDIKKEKTVTGMKKLWKNEWSIPEKWN